MVGLSFSSRGIGHVSVLWVQSEVSDTVFRSLPEIDRLIGRCRYSRPRNKWDSCPLIFFESDAIYRTWIVTGMGRS